LRTELNDIQTNPQNPLHTGFKNNDPSVSKQIDEKYKAVYGSAPVEIGNKGITLGEDPAVEEQRAEEKTRLDVEDGLKREWGVDYESNINVAKEAAVKVFQTVYPNREEATLMLDRFSAVFLAMGGDEAGIKKMLLNIGKHWRD